jgi:hypothetical protein
VAPTFSNPLQSRRKGNNRNVALATEGMFKFDNGLFQQPLQSRRSLADTAGV